MRAILSWILAMGLAVTPVLAGTEGTASKESSSNSGCEFSAGGQAKYRGFQGQYVQRSSGGS